MTPSEQTITFQSDSLTLSGTFLLPGEETSYPAVLLIPGSGQVDRDENSPKIAINAMREIAELLAGHGIASLRYDKRGVGQSPGDYWTTGYYDRITDARAALEWMKTNPHVNHQQIFLLGHSEGCGISAKLGAENKDLAGIILLAGWAQPGQDMLIWQAEKVFAGMKGINAWLVRKLRIDIRKAQLKQFARIRRSKKDTYRQFHVRINARWLREFLSYNPADDLNNVSIPVLAITGSKDIQVDPADLDRMQELVKGKFESHLVPDLTHMLRTDPGSPSTGTYAEQVKRPVDSGLLELVVSWLMKQIDR
jgi:pimeloyl-ACP methyl ester carboxylesterase